MAWLRSGFSGFLRSAWKSFRLIPSANLLLSYVGRLTIARISPVCGFMTIITPRLRPARCIAQVTAFSASFCSLVSIVSVRESPGWASRSVVRTWSLRPAASRSTVSWP